MQPIIKNIYRAFLFCAFSILILSCGSKDLTYYEQPEIREAKLERLIELMSGSFITESGITGVPEIMKTVRLGDFKRALYVEVSPQGSETPVYQAVWKFFDVDGELEMQFWRLTDPPRFAGAIEDEELRSTIWMYHLREYDGCRMDILNLSEPEQDTNVTEFKTTFQQKACELGEPVNGIGNLEFFVSSNDIKMIASDSDANESIEFKRH